MNGFTMDAGGLIALDRGDRRITALLKYSKSRGGRVTVPATALAQVVRNSARQARLRLFLKQRDIDIVPLDGLDASSVGILLARTGTSDVVDAHVAVCARRAGQSVVTSDAGDLRRIAPDLPLVAV